jgi:tetratricopeptide (TPR) repeat protein
MNLKALLEFREQSQALHARRHQSASDNYAKGLQAFEIALQSQFHDKQALKSAMDLWFKAMKTHRQNPKPVIAIGYVFMLLGDRVQALRYFKHAQGIQSDHPDVKLFIEALSRTEEAEVKPTDSDQVYAQIEERLFKHQTWLRNQPVPQAVITPEERADLTARVNGEKSVLAEILSQVQQLDQTVDTHLLDYQIHRIEMAMQASQKALLFSEIFSHLHQTMQALEQTVAEVYHQLKADRALAHQALEQLLDRCDKIADQLDDTEGQGVSIALLETPYQQLLQKVSLLQDCFDEMA